MTTPRQRGRLAPHIVVPEAHLVFSPRDAEAVDTHPLRGLRHYGPYSAGAFTAHSDAVRVAIVGPDEGFEGRRAVMKRLRDSGEPTDRKEYLPPYPGFEDLFGVPIVPAVSSAHLTWPSTLDELGQGDPIERVRRTIRERMRRLGAVREQFDVALVHLPDGWNPALRGDGFDAHDEVKAAGAELGIPTQVINDATFDFPLVTSLSWRLAIAFYVKAAGVPWRLAPIPGVPADTAYLGLGYALRGEGEQTKFVTCCSQVFDADGGGMQFVAFDADDPIENTREARRNPYLSRADMRAVVARSLALYQQRNGGNIPRRVVLHKNTPFKPDELDGTFDALAGVNEIECLHITGRVAWRGVRIVNSRNPEERSRPDQYPVHRGTMIPLDGTSALLWIAGNAPSVAQRGNAYYQGSKSIPSPVRMTRQAGSGPLDLIAAEVLALTKMDWNNDALYDPLPVTVLYAQRLANTISHVPTLPRRPYPYRLFM